MCPPARREVLLYLFGESDVAARRLGVLAEVFAESTRAFLRETVVCRPRLAVDVGCGPGYSTHFLAGVVRSERTVGLDNSQHLISLAQKTETGAVSFRLHDVTSVPFPVGPAGLLYCRFVLTHLREPQAAILKWLTQAAPEGVLAIEEVEWIRTANPVFETYLKMVEAMLAHHSNCLYVGPLVDAVQDTHIRKRASHVRRLAVANRDAATMFVLNLRAWKDQPFIRANYPASVIEELEGGLSALAGGSGGDTEIQWGLRQIALGRG